MQSLACIISSEVPQGSILGPLLFVQFMNDLPTAVQQCNVLMYADHTMSFFADRDSGVIQNVLTTELKNLKAWLMENKLSLNRKKLKPYCLELTQTYQR